MIAAPRHTVLVRITHWVATASVAALLVSGVAILLAHPRLYWGETGGVGGPSLIDLPLPFILAGQSGWGRSLHFLSAWIIVICGVVYVAAGIMTRHFRGRLFSRGGIYNTTQRLTYAAVVFVLLPLLIWTGLAMSPAVVSVAPVLVTTFGGQQTARTVHFIAASALVVFILGHVVMVCLNGPVHLVMGMLMPRRAAPHAAREART